VTWATGPTATDRVTPDNPAQRYAGRGGDSLDDTAAQATCEDGLEMAEQTPDRSTIGAYAPANKTKHGNGHTKERSKTNQPWTARPCPLAKEHLHIS
jgi:hypothetical protein